MSTRYNVGIIGYSWAATAHIGAINATTRGIVTDVYSCAAARCRRAHRAARLSRSGCTRISRRCSLTPASRWSTSPAIRISTRAQFIARGRAPASTSSSRSRSRSSGTTSSRCKAALKGSGSRTCVCFECRYSSQFLATKAVIDAGLLGALHYGEIDYYHGIGPWYGQYRWNTKTRARRQRAAHRGLPRAGCAAAVHGERRRGGHELRHPERQSDLQGLRVSDVVDDDPEVQERRRRQVRRDRRLPAAVLLPHAPGRAARAACSTTSSTRRSSAGLNRQAWSQLSMKMLDSGDVADHPYQTQFQAFFDALDRGEEMPLTSFADGFATHRSSRPRIDRRGRAGRSRCGEMRAESNPKLQIPSSNALPTPASSQNRPPRPPKERGLVRTWNWLRRSVLGIWRVRWSSGFWNLEVDIVSATCPS